MEEEGRRETAGVQVEEGARGEMPHMSEKHTAGRWRGGEESEKGGRQGGEGEDSRHSSGGEPRGERRPRRGERALVKMEMY